MQKKVLIYTVMAMLALAGQTSAHRLKVFAASAGDRVEGFAYFPGGDRAQDCTVSVLDADGEPLATLTTDGQGAFVYTPTQACDHVFRASTVEGHAAVFTIFEHQLPGATVAVNEGLHRAATAPSTVKNEPFKPQGEGQWGTGDLQRAVDVAVAERIRPLREEVELLRNETRMRDVIGGIGYIVGLFGLVALFMRRKGPSK